MNREQKLEALMIRFDLFLRHYEGDDPSDYIELNFLEAIDIVKKEWLGIKGNLELE